MSAFRRVSLRVSESRMLRSASRRASRSAGAAVAEQPLEDDLRVDLHRQRLVGRRPRDRVRIRAAVALSRSTPEFDPGSSIASWIDGSSVSLADLLAR